MSLAVVRERVRRIVWKLPEFRTLTSDHDDASVYTPAMQKRIYRGDAGYVPVPSRCPGASYASVVSHRVFDLRVQVFHEGLKYWSCCKDTNKPVLDFESFMAMPVRTSLDVRHSLILTSSRNA